MESGVKLQSHMIHLLCEIFRNYSEKAPLSLFSLLSLNPIISLYESMNYSKPLYAIYISSHSPPKTW